MFSANKKNSIVKSAMTKPLLDSASLVLVMMMIEVLFDLETKTSELNVSQVFGVLTDSANSR